MSGQQHTTTVKVRRSSLSGEISVHPASSERWPDIKVLFDGHGERGCWCQYWRQSSSEYAEGAPGSGEQNLQRQTAEGPVTGILAYVDGVPAG